MFGRIVDINDNILKYYIGPIDPDITFNLMLLEKLNIDIAHINSFTEINQYTKISLNKNNFEHNMRVINYLKKHDTLYPSCTIELLFDIPTFFHKIMSKETIIHTHIYERYNFLTRNIDMQNILFFV